eukprot:scaffold104222_cov24-Tisochrysis_lutea.AAC.1
MKRLSRHTAVVEGCVKSFLMVSLKKVIALSIEKCLVKSAHDAKHACSFILRRTGQRVTHIRTRTRAHARAHTHTCTQAHMHAPPGMLPRSCGLWTVQGWAAPDQ